MQNNFLPNILLRNKGHKYLNYHDNDCSNTIPVRNSLEICKISQAFRYSTTRNRIKYENFIQQKPLELMKQQNIATFKLKFNDLNAQIDKFFLRHRRERTQSINY